MFGNKPVFIFAGTSSKLNGFPGKNYELLMELVFWLANISFEWTSFSL